MWVLDVPDVEPRSRQLGHGGAGGDLGCEAEQALLIKALLPSAGLMNADVMPSAGPPPIPSMFLI